MKAKFLFFLIVGIVLFTAVCVRAQDDWKRFFHTKRAYHYNTLYIDAQGDTLIREHLVMRVLNRPWSGQPWKQRSVRFESNLDSATYSRYVDPEPAFHYLDSDYVARKGRLRYSPTSTTGGAIEYVKKEKYTEFYLHPPRWNQYRMLFYAPHWKMRIYDESDSVYSFQSGLGIISWGTFNQPRTVRIVPKQQVFGQEVDFYKMHVTSTIADSLKNGDYIYDSTLDAIFTKEYGFTELLYEFENGIKIQFFLERVE